MKKFIFGFLLGLAVGMYLAPDPNPEEFCSTAENMTCSAAKIAASRVCDCQIVCYEDRK